MPCNFMYRVLSNSFPPKETSLMSMYYGGGDNLVPGVTYYVHIQTYSGDRGWGDLQIKEFTMPR